MVRPRPGAAAVTADGGRRRLPVGTVTFLLTDIEGSTLHWQNEPDLIATSVSRHYEILDAAVAAHGGVRPEEQGEGDSIVAAFPRASDAVAAALLAQKHLQSEEWQTAPLRVRMAIHTGEAQMRDESNYVGLPIIRTARLRSLAAGGQVLVSSASRDLALDQLDPSITLRDMGEHRLKDLSRRERVYQLVHEGIISEFPPLRSLDSTPNNLPVRLSSFIGRHHELAGLADMLSDRRLVTMVGSGGAGKTRLALQAAADAVDRYPDGVWWVELAPMTEPSSVTLAVAEVVGARLGEAEEDSEMIARRLGDDRALIVMDNCEHVLEAASMVVDALVAQCPNLSLIATSRMPLEVPGELVWRVPSMALPVPGTRPALRELATLDSVRLFTDRAREVRPAFALTDANAAAIAEICHRLDGIPLAIELAAARTKTMLPEQILAGLSDALRLLTGGPRRVLARHQTLDASIEWSVQLLSDVERTLLVRLSVFSGSFDLPSAEAVCSGGGVPEVAVLDALERLVDSSLVLADNGDGVVRFTMLETVRQFGARRLAASHDSEHWREHHAAHFERFAHEVAPACETSQQDDAIDAMAADYDNVRASLQWLLHNRRGDRLGAMVLSCGSFWDVSGVRADAAFWCARALRAIDDEPSSLRCRLLALSAESRIQIGEFTAGFLDAAAGLEMATTVDDAWAAGRASSTLTTILGVLDLDAWRTRWADTDRLLRESADSYSLARLHTWRGVPLLRRGILREGSAALAEAASVVDALGQPMLIASQRMWEGYAALYSAGPLLAEELSNAALTGRALRGTARIEIARTTIAIARAMQFLDREPSHVHLARVDRARRNNDPLLADLHCYCAALELLHEDPAGCRRLVDDWHAEHERRSPLSKATEAVLAAYAAYSLGELDDAAARAEAIVRWSDECGDVRDHASALVVLGAVALRRGDTPVAEQRAREAIAENRTNDNMLHLCDAMELLAAVATACGDHTEAGTILGATGRLRAELSSPRGYLIDLAGDAITHARSEAASEAFDMGFAAGAQFGVDDAIAYLERTRGRRGRPSLGWHSLTPTELQVAEMVRVGMTNREIGAQLIMGTETVKTHMSHIFTKLGISKRAQLAVLVAEHAARADDGGPND